ncbi:MAG TPA: addiction module antidote protein [Terracidiphilus sp.]|jgi:probable addiction module antidote protein|nr:addiction module antidote protein [Terracidiphilus sp.]
MPSKSYAEWQLKKLANPNIAASFLNAARADSPEIFLKALKKVAQAHQMTWVAKQANVQRETLYRSLSEGGNPTHLTLSSVLEALDLDFQVIPKAKQASLDLGPSVIASKEQDEVTTVSGIGPRDVELFRSLSAAIISAAKQRYGSGLDEEIEWNQISPPFEFRQQNVMAGMGAL